MITPLIYLVVVVCVVTLVWILAGRLRLSDSLRAVVRVVAVAISALLAIAALMIIEVLLQLTGASAVAHGLSLIDRHDCAGVALLTSTILLVRLPLGSVSGLGHAGVLHVVKIAFGSEHGSGVDTISPTGKAVGGRVRPRFLPLLSN